MGPPRGHRGLPTRRTSEPRRRAPGPGPCYNPPMRAEQDGRGGRIGLHDFLSLVKVGIVGSNDLTAMAGFALAASRAGGMSAVLWAQAALVLGGTSALIAGCCVLNNWIDRNIDALMERTRARPAAAGRAGAGLTLGLGFALVGIGEALLAATGAAAALVGLAGAFTYVVLYTLWSKRRTGLSSFIGGISGSIPPLIGWAAVDPELGGPAWILFAFLVTWQQAHVRALALMRAEEYRGAGLPMAGLATPGGVELPAGEARSGEARSRLAVLAWAAALLPFPFLILGLAGACLALALFAALLDLAWIGYGVFSLRRGRAEPAGSRPPGTGSRMGRPWPRRMFVASLAYLVLVFGALLAAPLLG